MRTWWGSAVLLAAGLLWLAPVRAADTELSRVQVAHLGKAATALVEVTRPGGKAYGTAFCIDPSGLFVSNEHVTRFAGPRGTVTLVLNPSLKTQRVLHARVLRADRDRDLALLRVEGARDLPALTLGSADDLDELMEVIAFGFPFGTLLNPDRRDYPSISINVGSITALRRRQGVLHRIQVDAVLNPGNSGGPVLDRKGKVVGVVVAGVRGAGVNFVIPVTHLTAFLTHPELEFRPPVVDRARMHRPALFEARAVSLVPSAAPLRLELILQAGAGPERRFPMVQKGAVYQTRAVPVPPPEGPATLHVTVQYPNGSVSGEVVDREVKVGGKAHRLREVRSASWQPRPQVVLDDGKTCEGPVAGLDPLELRLGQQTLRLSLASASTARIDGVPSVSAVSCTVVAQQDGKEVARASATLTFPDLAPVVSAVPGRTSGGERSVGLRVPTLEGEKVVRSLPAPAADAVVGGGGRYLVLHLPSLRKLAVFDTGEARVVGYVPLTDNNVQFAAGLDKLVLVYPDTKLSSAGTWPHVSASCRWS